MDSDTVTSGGSIFNNKFTQKHRAVGSPRHSLPLFGWLHTFCCMLCLLPLYLHACLDRNVRHRIWYKISTAAPTTTNLMARRCYSAGYVPVAYALPSRFTFCTTLHLA